jgi:hypothetical protein
VGKGACRGEGWSEGVWPIAAGQLGAGDCCSRCINTQVTLTDRQIDRQTDRRQTSKQSDLKKADRRQLVGQIERQKDRELVRQQTGR